MRRAAVADARIVAVIRNRGWQSAYRGHMPDAYLDALSVDDTAARWRARLADETNYIFICEHEGRAVGFVATARSRDEDAADKAGEIVCLHILPEEWRKGYGRRLLDAALAHLTAEGFADVTLWVLQGNERACRFYEALGFARDGATKVERLDGLELQEFRFRRKL